MNKQLNPARNIGESYKTYRARRRKVNKAVRRYLHDGSHCYERLTTAAIGLRKALL